ncbi:hypothetical protein FRC11_012375 [Ceratobasidium sp. 423]|nr:hypothetical protein FRC11_012375 [Ceratobasidium sp. 423]
MGIITLTDEPKEWAIDSILQHVGKGKEMSFEVKWKNGDVTWEPYHTVKHLDALVEYLELQGMSNVLGLKWTAEFGDLEQEFGPDKDNELDHNTKGDTTEGEESSTKAQPPMEANAIDICSVIVNPSTTTSWSSSPSHYIHMLCLTLPRINMGVYDALSLAYAFTGTETHPGPEPECYKEFRGMLKLLADTKRKAHIGDRSHTLTPAHTPQALANTPTGPRVLRVPLANRIGSWSKPYEQPRTHTSSGEKYRRFWEGRDAKAEGLQRVQGTWSTKPVLTTTAHKVERPATNAKTEGKANNNSVGDLKVAGMGIGSRNVEMDRGITDTISRGTGMSDQHSIQQREDDWGLEEIITDEDWLPFDEYA